MSSSYIIMTAVGLAGVLFAAWKGGSPERIAASVVAANMLLGFGSRFIPGFEDPFRFINDGLAAVALLGVTVVFGALWTGGVMLFYAAQFSLHAYYFVVGRPETDRLSAIINDVNFSGILWCLVIGSAVSWRRRVKAARDAAALR